jgi:hypothetical protein
MIVGIVGFISSGKGTVGDMLEARGFVSESFAKPLKDACAIIFGWDRELLEGKTEESRAWRERVDPYWAKVLGKPNFSPRLALQWMGTEAGRNVFGENVWTASCINRCYRNEHTVITDCRFKNEVRAIEDAGGFIIRVQRGPDPVWFDILTTLDDCIQPVRTEYMKAQAPDLHISEWDWVGCDFDYTLLNDGSLGELNDRVSLLVKLLENTP